MTTITGPGELASLVPSLIGFQPEDSVVAVLIRERGELGALVRLDERDLVGEDGHEVAHALAVHAMREGARRAVVLAYTEDTETVLDAIDVAIRALEETVATVEGWVVAGGRYFSPGCEDARCCPPGGRPVPAGGRGPVGDVRLRRDPGSSRAPAPQRRLAARAARRWEARAARDLSAWRQASASRWRRALDDAPDGPAAWGALAAGLADVRVRDAVLLMLVPDAEDAVRDALAGHDSDAVAQALGHGLVPSAPPRPERADQARRLLIAVLEHAPGRLCAPAAATLAVIAWWCEPPAVARAWCAIALDHDREYRLALLVLALIDTGPRAL
ncbi:DUF4192 family protein [Demequina gelatinilytica]|uniref:DUF4192 family protein n=1 Tax=Demequina gelatinilytica TaxID=1638980 RepID=UPI000784EBFD|nr:DUF4192 family protein [Demequina gelatinilytica]